MRRHQDNCDVWNQCNCCDCDCDYHHHRPRPQRKKSAQFVNTESQIVTHTEAIRFNDTPVKDAQDIVLQPPTNILLAPGRYLISYYLTVENKDGDDDTLIARLKLNNDTLEYTIGRLLVDNENDDDSNKPLSKTNLVDVPHSPISHSTLQLVVTSFHEQIKFKIKDASIVIEKIS